MVRGDFREDLYYRLKVIEAYVPPLRERRDEIPKLTDFFLRSTRSGTTGPCGRSPTSCEAIPRVRLAGQRPRAREHDQAVRHSAGRIARHARTDRPRLVPTCRRWSRDRRRFTRRRSRRCRTAAAAVAAPPPAAAAEN
jgi:transcriptional regulator with GAF, ATPase, and Fis domain